MIINYRRGNANTTTAATRYLDINFASGTQLQLRITPQGIEPLRADTDSDGTFETGVPPTVEVTGAATNDLDAPMVAISAAGPLAAKMVTITAADSGAGVKQLLYSLDGMAFQLYTAPFVVDATQMPVVYAFADDNVANRSSLVTWRLAWPIYLPLTAR
ncbi:MAG: hypothetical protein NZU74_10575 [Chloroflexaceae bacterium]|nr:hypothetical protein [Chloroflexaceae bacterium]